MALDDYRVNPVTGDIEKPPKGETGLCCLVAAVVLALPFFMVLTFALYPWGMGIGCLIYNEYPLMGLVLLTVGPVYIWQYMKRANPVVNNSSKYRFWLKWLSMEAVCGAGLSAIYTVVLLVMVLAGIVDFTPTMGWMFGFGQPMIPLLVKVYREDKKGFKTSFGNKKKAQPGKICPYCSYRNPEGSNYCMGCGAMISGDGPQEDYYSSY